MKQWSVLAFLGLTTAALAQEGRVGINTTAPKATLEVKSSTANANATTNEGIIAPKLTKARIAQIAAPQEGTLVYALNTTYSGTNSKVAKITEKGYYFYNGTEWVKVRDTNIYTENGTLSTDRIVNLDNKTLTFSGTNARIKVPNMQEQTSSMENVSNVVISSIDGTLRKRTGFWRLGDGPMPSVKDINVRKYILDIGEINVEADVVKVRTQFEFACGNDANQSPKTYRHTYQGQITIPKSDWTWVSLNNQEGVRIDNNGYLIFSKLEKGIDKDNVAKKYSMKNDGIYQQCCYNKDENYSSVFWLSSTNGIQNGDIKGGRVFENEYNPRDQQCKQSMIYFSRQIRAIEYDMK